MIFLAAPQRIPVYLASMGGKIPVSLLRVGMFILLFVTHPINSARSERSYLLVRSSFFAPNPSFRQENQFSRI